MIDAERIVAEVRSWIGTPYQHQASVAGVGSDCLGLLRGIWRAFLGDEPETVPPYTDDWAEPAREELLFQAAGRWLVSKDIADALPGDVLLFRMRQGSIAKHLGVQTVTGERAAFVHAYSGLGVVESPLSQPWQRRIVARFTFPEGAA